MKFSRKLLVGIVALMFSASAVYAQNARSLFVAGSGASFNTSAGNSNIPEELKPSEGTSGGAKHKRDESSAKGAGTQNSSKTNTYETTKKEVSKKTAPKNETFTGLSYSIFMKGGEGKYSKTTPNRVFHGGDRIKIEVSSNIPGRLYTVNINPKGEINLLSVETISSRAVTRIPQNGDLKFTGTPGTETIMFILEKSNSLEAALNEDEVGSMLKMCKKEVGTRSLVVDDVAGNSFSLLSRDGNCGASTRTSNNTRSIVVDVEDDAGYGVVSDSIFGEDEFFALTLALNHK